MHHTYKEAIATKLSQIVNQLSNFDLKEEPPTLDECFKLLGMCKMRLSFIKDIEYLIQRQSNYSFIRTKVTELDDLKEMAIKQSGLIQKLIRHYLRELTKKGIKV